MRTLETLAADRDARISNAQKQRDEGISTARRKLEEAQKRFEEQERYYNELHDKMVSCATRDFESGKAMVEKHAANPPKVYVSRAKARTLNNKDDPAYVAALKAARAENPNLNAQEFFAQWSKDHPQKKVKATADTKDKKPSAIPSYTEPEHQVTPPVSLPPAPTKEEERADMFGALGDLIDDEESSADDWSSVDDEEIAAAAAALKVRFSEPPALVAAPVPVAELSVPEPIGETVDTPLTSLAALEAEEAELAALREEAEKAEKSRLLAEQKKEEQDRLRAAARLPIISLASINNHSTTEEPSHYPNVLSTTKKPVRKAGIR